MGIRIVYDAPAVLMGAYASGKAEGLLEEIVGVARRYVSRCDRSVIQPTSFWTSQLGVGYKE